MSLSKVVAMLLISTDRQNAFAMCICSGVLHASENSCGEATKIQTQRALERRGPR
jgi:hypothetical protein